MMIRSRLLLPRSVAGATRTARSSASSRLLLVAVSTRGKTARGASSAATTASSGIGSSRTRALALLGKNKNQKKRTNAHPLSTEAAAKFGSAAEHQAGGGDGSSGGEAAAGLSNLGKLFFGSLCGGTFLLGCWQAQRLVEKRELITKRESDLAMEPSRDWTRLLLPQSSAAAAAASAEEVGDGGGGENFRRYVLRGTFRHDREFLVGPRGPPPGALPDKPGSSAAGMSSAPQGYFVVTPMELAAGDGAGSGGGEEAVSVLVNRGWVPRNMVMKDYRDIAAERRAAAAASGGGGDAARPTTGEQRRRRTLPLEDAIRSADPSLFKWDRPSGTVEVVAIPTKPEEPRFLVAEHKVKEKPAVLYWYDWPAMMAVGGLSFGTAGGGDRPALVMTAVQQGGDEGDETTAKKPSDAPSWPVQPTAAKVGEFKVSPAVHAGYAFTWFGLSGAGLYMTRKLITRGR